jgi:hypothetical protein
MRKMVGRKIRDYGRWIELINAEGCGGMMRSIAESVLDDGVFVWEWRAIVT